MESGHGCDGKGAAPALLVRDPALEGADGVAFDRNGRLWVASTKSTRCSGSAYRHRQTIARNTSAGPLEFPSAIVFVGDRAHVSNFDVPRRDNLDASGSTARDGVGASIAVIAP